MTREALLCAPHAASTVLPSVVLLSYNAAIQQWGDAWSVMRLTELMLSPSLVGLWQCLMCVVRHQRGAGRHLLALPHLTVSTPPGYLCCCLPANAAATRHTQHTGHTSSERAAEVNPVPRCCKHVLYNDIKLCFPRCSECSAVMPTPSKTCTVMGPQLPGGPGDNDSEALQVLAAYLLKRWHVPRQKFLWCIRCHQGLAKPWQVGAVQHCQT